MLELARIEQQSIRNKWQRRFARHHDAEVREWSRQLAEHQMSGPYARCYVAAEERRELGFIRIHDKSRFFARYTDAAVWNLTAAFVKPARRHEGILREMITRAVRELDVRMMSISTDSLARYENYYSSLGFTCFYPVRGGDMTWAFVTGFEDVVASLMQEPRDDHRHSRPPPQVRRPGRSDCGTCGLRQEMVCAEVALEKIAQGG